MSGMSTTTTSVRIAATQIADGITGYYQGNADTALDAARRRATPDVYEMEWWNRFAADAGVTIPIGEKVRSTVLTVLADRLDNPDPFASFQ